MKTFTIVAIVTALTFPVYAQGFNNNPQNSSGKPGAKSDQERAEEAKQRKDEDKAYKDSLIADSRSGEGEESRPVGNVR